MFSCFSKLHTTGFKDDYNATVIWQSENQPQRVDQSAMLHHMDTGMGMDMGDWRYDSPFPYVLSMDKDNGIPKTS